MRLSYLIYAYLVFTVIEILGQIIETWRQERKYIKQGGAPIGDSTYYVYFSNLFFRILAGALILIFGNNVVIHTNNDWVLVLIILGIYLGLLILTSALAAIPITIVTNHKIKKRRERLNAQAPRMTEDFMAKQNNQGNDK